MTTCDRFWIARPDNPLAEPNCFRCHRPLREHDDELARGIKAAIARGEAIDVAKEQVKAWPPLHRVGWLQQE